VARSAGKFPFTTAAGTLNTADEPDPRRISGS
jgi:hypothetical protein